MSRTENNIQKPDLQSRTRNINIRWSTIGRYICVDGFVSDELMNMCFPLYRNLNVFQDPNF